MESTQELKHYGIKGQKWGIRRYENPDGTLTEAGKKRYRYQNPDGSLTEEGKKDYMTAAKKGKLDVSKLSDNDLNMINSRFARENTYKQNIQKYEESKFSNQLKKAVIDRVKGSGGGGKGKSKGGIASLLAMPIKKAFEDAFKEDGKSGGGNNDKENQNSKPKAEEDDDEVRRGFKRGRHFARYGYKESDELRESRIKNGKRFLEGSLPLSMGPNRTAEEGIRSRKKPEVVRKNDEWWENSMNSPDSWGWSSMRFDTSEYLVHGASKYAISRSDELYHYGIKGQKWGIRRFENPDGTLTEEGKRRYGYIKLDIHSELNRARENQKIAAKKLMDANFLTKARAAKAATAADEKLKEVENVYNDLLKHQKEVDEYNKRKFDAAKKEIHENGFESWWNKNRSTDNEDAFCDHIWNTQGKLLDAWWNERYELNYDDRSWKRVQQKYVKQLAKNLGLPQTKEVNEYLSDWFVNGDD